jgi:glycosyltransferase involved in cell wall biosynthesis
MIRRLRILALEPYYAGSHRAFLDGWSAASRHDWTLLTLPGHHWKWRMRHASRTLATEAARAEALAVPGEGGSPGWDVVLCSDMLNLPEWRGLAPRALRSLRAVAYFHENQATYPVRRADERDVHFALTNMHTALAAEGVWFNSEYHLRSFADGLGRLLRRMPGPECRDAPGRIAERARVEPPGIDASGAGDGDSARPPGPVRIAWAARWEHDKGPETFFAAMDRLIEREVAFRVSVLGEGFADRPAVFDEAKGRLAGRLDRWGYEPDRAGYLAALSDADLAVSTAEHEFFGLSMLEAAACGTVAVLPERLAYPEVFAQGGAVFYDGSTHGLVETLIGLTRRIEQGDDLVELRQAACATAAQYDWSVRAPAMDEAIMQL